MDRHQEVGEWSLDECRHSIMELAKELNRVLKNLKQNRSLGQVERREGADLRTNEGEEHRLKIAYYIMREWPWKLKTESENSVSAGEDVEQRLSELVQEWKRGQLKNILPIMEFILWELMKEETVQKIVLSIQKTPTTGVSPAEPQAAVLTLYLGLDEALTIADPSAAESVSSRPAQSPFYSNNVNLKWVQWTGTLPKDTVSIYNKHYSRHDYVARVGVEGSPGFYTPSKGSYCYYAMSNKEERTSDFDLLVNEDNFELLQWKMGFFDILPDSSVMANSGGTIVGRNKYGLGKVVPQFKAFFQPRDGKEYFFKLYEVLSFVPELYSQKIYDVRYSLGEMKLTRNPEREIPPYDLYNDKEQPILKTVTSQICVPVHRMWDIRRPTQADAITSITAQIPVISLREDKSDSLTPVKEFNCTQGTSLSESETQELRFEVTVLPRSTTAVLFEAERVTVEIPFTAQLSRSYKISGTRHTTISGVYRALHISEVKAVVDGSGPV
ncbi:Natterin-4 [Acipenser ruthenus]|uniref:Natterin-4 n=1 Tax=Acipenser ruthenus TaxID=7906 RepID=A0A444UYR7_ACIRT|nr:Natterin-4 [Acipenser ruthenus]